MKFPVLILKYSKYVTLKCIITLKFNQGGWFFHDPNLGIGHIVQILEMMAEFVTYYFEEVNITSKILKTLLGFQ